ncbi:hypothetical protein F0562_035201 [Nyssa sinensis]|uniref:Cysteine proteinase inhibitor n=1 Tax=Nyssa sinensis TaxID=561372 RepID=A0A5J5ABK8_9ASTE|nr:hypothetical protein F0562_035201 [Nyssa sinensis]
MPPPVKVSTRRMIQFCAVALTFTRVLRRMSESEAFPSLQSTNKNENQYVHLQFVRVVGASHTGLSSCLYYITLEATDARKEKIYHAVVWLQLWKNLMELLVWKPVNDALSAVGVKHGNYFGMQPLPVIIILIFMNHIRLFTYLPSCRC